MKKPVIKFLLKVLLFVIVIAAFFEILFLCGCYPVVTNSTFFDQKMFSVQKQHIKHVELMAIGSSVALYELNSPIMVHNFNIPYYNFASWNLQITDTRVLLTDFVKRYHPRYVILCSSINDFISPANSTYLNYVNAPDFIKYHLPEAFYLKNYTSAYQVVRRKLNSYPLAVDQWGGAFLTAKQINKAKWDEHNIFPTRYTGENYEALDSLGSFLKAQNIKLIFIQVPLKKSYAGTPQSSAVLSAHFARCKSIVEQQGGIYLNYHNTNVFTDSLFTDQYHLQLNGAVMLTNQIVKDLKGIIR